MGSENLFLINLIAFWPLLIWFIALFAFGGWSIPGFTPAATVALYAVPVTMVAVVFTYKGVTRRNILWIDIFSFFIAVGVALTIFTLLATELVARQGTVSLSLLFLVILGVAFARYPAHPPVESDLFLDPLNNQYGLSAPPDN